MSSNSKPPRFTKLELHVLNAVWAQGRISIREIHESFAEPAPAYTTVQTTVNRLEAKQALRRVRKIGNAHIYEALVERDAARLRWLDEVLSVFGGRALPMMSQLAEAGRLTLDDVRELEKTIKRLNGDREDRKGKRS